MSRLMQQSSVPVFVPGLSALAVPLALVVTSALALAWQVAHPAPVVVAGLSVDRLGALAGLFVSMVGSVVIGFAARSMQGHPERSRFLALLSFATCMAFVICCASNLLLLCVAWVLLGAGVHMLLMFGGESPTMRRVARRKFVFARVGDTALLAAAVLLWWHGRSLELGACLGAVTTTPGSVLLLIALLLAVAAMVRSVQVPFHAWLPDSMEAPTPVSALLHAGIVNAGGILLIRFAPVLVRAPEACLVLSMVGTATIVTGVLAAARQVRLKQSLAWSTVAQMGFMTVQCGLGAFASALLHLIGHGAYKASAFLRSGEAPATAAPPRHAGWNLLLLASGTASAVPALGFTATITGFPLWQDVGESALAIVVALAVGQAWIAALGVPGGGLGGSVRGALCAVFVSALAPSLCLWMYRCAQSFLHPVLGDLPTPHGAMATVTAALPVAAIVLLSLAHAMDPWLQRLAAWRRMQVQARDGFHLSRRTDRLFDAMSISNLKQEFLHV